ncbi:MAG: tetratricopeptide repeat protein [Acidobacteriota bacterium]
MRRVTVLICVMAGMLLSLSAFAKQSQDKKEAKKNPKIEELIDKGHYQQAVDLAQKFIKNKQETYPLYLDLGVAYYKMKKFPEALQAFEKAASLNPFDSKALEYEISVYYAMGDTAKVISTSEQVLQTNPDNKEILYNLGHLYEKQGDMDKAMEKYNQLIDVDPKYKGVGYDVGVMLYKKDKYDQSIQVLEKTRTADPDNAKVLLALGQDYIKTKNYEKAVPVLQDYVKKTDRDVFKPAVLKNIAVIQTKMKKYDEAAATCDQILALRPNDESAILMKAQSLLDAKDYDKALPVLKQYLSVSQNQDTKKKVEKLVKQLERRKK